ncbi:hypothetical protein SASPL_118102 [Salvia splendens]|uniref:Pentatricopeptide repeat-containing protein n=1 Tax=Salvia splendens TaxID=180675 RepID=A0A8X8Y1R5_SALSN|nr:hypothetical protein SASPL_118102 [Salvia splendens]
MLGNSLRGALRSSQVKIDPWAVAFARVSMSGWTAEHPLRLPPPAAVPPPPLKLWLRQHWKASSLLILPEMKSIGYTPDCGTCNYLFLTLLKISQFGEAVEVLKGMGRAGCVPDCEDVVADVVRR